MHRRTSLWLVALLLSLCAGALAAEPGPAERDGWPADTRGAVPRTTAPPTIDGTIRPDEWATAAEFNAQVSQGWGVSGHHLYPRSVTWYLAWDDENLYLASRTALLPNERPKRTARTNVGSSLMSDDTLELWLDPKGRNAGEQLASYFQTMVNALGITYFCRLYPQVGGRTEDWHPAWTVRTGVTADTMDVEIQMPVAGFALKQPNKSGDAWGMMLARNFMFETWNQSPMAYAFPNFGFAVNSYYPLMTLQDGKPFVKFRCPLALYEGKAFADATVTNPGGEPDNVTARLTISTSGEAPVTLFEREATLDLPAGGSAQWKVDEGLQPPMDAARSALYRYAFTVIAQDGTEVFHTHFLYDPTESREWLARTFPPPPELTSSASFNPVRFMLQTNVDVIDFPREADITSAKTVVLDEAGTAIAESERKTPYLQMYTDFVRLPVLQPGKYSWETSVTLKDGTSVPAGGGAFEKKDEAKEFAWWNANLGNAEKVLWPYTPVRAEREGQVLRAWGKEYRLDGLALPTQVLCTGNTDRWPPGRSGEPEVLAAPVRLDAVVNGAATEVKVAPRPRVVSAADHRIALAGRATAGGLRLRTATKLEQDGAYFVELTLAPAVADRPVTVDRLDLSIPLRGEVATFLNAYAHCGFSGYFIDYLPSEPVRGGPKRGRSTVWDASLCGAPSVTVGDFIPQIWMGNEFRGLLWYADSDQGWTPTDGVHSQQIDREGDRAILVHHLISVPTEIRDARTIRFVIQPTPIRPLQPGWRMLNTSFSQSFFDWDQAGRSNANYSASINLANDAAYATSKAFSERFKAFRADKPNLEMYFAPHTESSAIMTTIWDDRKYFGGEWEGGTYTDTLNDHTLWYVDKWISKGGLQGLYHDQFSPHRIDSVSSGIAYVLPDGRVQPGFALTTRREYVMREHALWMERGIIPPRTLTHVTNGGPLGSYGWIESGVDGEDKQLTKDMPLDYADTWPSTRIRAGSISYNMGITYTWMRLIDTRDMPEDQIRHHERAYIGHCMMHDVMNPFGFDWTQPRTKLLLGWGMNDDRVFFWPFWSNGDAISCPQEDVKVSAWTLPDRVLLCLFNYSKERPCEAQVTVNLKAMGVTLPPGAKAFDLERPETPPKADVSPDSASVRAMVPAREYVLLALAQPSTSEGGP